MTSMLLADALVLIVSFLWWRPQTFLCCRQKFVWAVDCVNVWTCS